MPAIKTEHRIYVKDSGKMDELSDESIDLVVTSPPYPMIAMWDELFSGINPEIEKILPVNGKAAYELMHKELDKTWAELKRVVKKGGTVCINIGDATRTIDNNFEIYPNHTRILTKMMELGFDVLPEIIWHKPTNSPNKFMGSGMLPAGAYVTLEHEYILIFRKSGKRTFSEAEKALRRKSSYFWEERNEWFSDIWDFKGKKQKMNIENVRMRSAAYPCELPKRLIQMFSIYGDTVLDPFLGTGTTTKAAVMFGRNSVGFEINGHLIESCKKELFEDVEKYKILCRARMDDHIDFVQNRMKYGKDIKHINEEYDIPVITSQERGMVLYYPFSLYEASKNNVVAEYKELNWVPHETKMPSRPVPQKITEEV